MKKISQLFVRGFIVLTPVTLTIYVVLALSSKMEGLFGNLLKSILGEQFYLPGFGIITTLIFIILTGMLVSHYVTNQLVEIILNQFEKFPLVKTIYGPLKDLMGFFSGKQNNSLKKVVLVKNINNQFSLGLVTRDDFSDINLPLEKMGFMGSGKNIDDVESSEEFVAVYFPMSFMMGGMTTLVPKSQIIEIDMPVDQAIKLAITSWAKSDRNGG